MVRRGRLVVVKVAVYDEWWSTGGGGEKFAAGIAQALAAGNDVRLLAHEPVDTEHLGERLQLDLRGVGVDVIDLGQGAVEEATEDYDLFVNASYMSRAVPRSDHSLYVVHFPNPPQAAPVTPKDRLREVLRPLVGAPGTSLSYHRGFHPEEQIAGRPVRWTTGDAVIEVTLPEGERTDVVVHLGRFVGVALGRVPYEVEVDGRTVLRGSLVARANRFARPTVGLRVPVEGRSGGEPVSVRIRSGTHVPAEAFGTDDHRVLGVPVAGVQIGDDLAALARRRYPSLAAAPTEFGWVRTYDRVVSNSEYTRTWVRRWWELDTAVLHPPVTLQTRTTKEQVILNVGRFFAPEHGHGKKQLDLVRAMRALVWRGRADGWVLHLVGGCAPEGEEYLAKVRAEAEGLPVEIHANAPGSLVAELYGKASIYWHATGLGEDPDTQPDRFEHFGITTAEAMSAGAVPVVIMAAGQEELVDHGRTGMLWEPVVQLVCFTEELIDDPERLATMSAATEAEARQYGLEAFGGRVRSLVDSITSRAASDPAGSSA